LGYPGWICTAAIYMLLSIGLPPDGFFKEDGLPLDAGLSQMELVLQECCCVHWVYLRRKYTKKIGYPGWNKVETKILLFWME
jgi:hypothetical protein